MRSQAFPAFASLGECFVRLRTRVDAGLKTHTSCALLLSFFTRERCVELLREEQILSLVDGAHALGQIPIDLDACKPDFFFSNLHKWLYGHRGSTFLYVDPKSVSFSLPLLDSTLSERQREALSSDGGTDEAHRQTARHDPEHAYSHELRA